MNHEPNFFENLRAELSNFRVWLDRDVVLGYAVTAGLCVVAFTMAADWAFGHFVSLFRAYPWAVLGWTPLLTVAIVYCTRRWFSGAAGSGIPQVKAALDPALPEDRLGQFVSLKLAAGKVLLGTAGFEAGLSIGREGPSVQVAAGVMQHARRWLSPGSAIDTRALLMAGGAAGIAAAFNAPLAGVVFAIEELAGGMEARASGVIITGIVLAGLVAVSAFGNLNYFGVIKVQPPSRTLLGPGLATSLAAGAAGGVFARLTPLYTLLKFVATWLTAWRGVPGGIFAPSLSIGAGIGDAVAQWSTPTLGPALIAMGMAGFLAAVTQSPLTAFIIVMEMVDGHSMVLSLMASAMLASLVSRMISRPLYGTLAEYMVGGALIAAPDGDAKTPASPAADSPEPAIAHDGGRQERSMP